MFDGHGGREAAQYSKVRLCIKQTGSLVELINIYNWIALSLLLIKRRKLIFT